MVVVSLWGVVGGLVVVIGLSFGVFVVDMVGW